MSSKQQQREYARRRYEKWLAHQQQVRARERRRAVVIGSVLGAIVLAVVVWLVVDATSADNPPDAGSPTPTADASVDPSAEPSAEPTPEPTNGPEVPDAAIAEGRTWTAQVSTSAGDLVLELDGANAPQAVASFVSLTRDGFFTGTSCHRLTTAGIFVLQCGDPTGTGTGGPDYRFGPIENAPADGVYPAGTLAMARVGNDAFSNGSQFFLVYEDSTIPADAAGGYTVFGQVVEGMDVLTAVAEAGVVEGTEQPTTTVTIEGVEVE